MGNERFTVWDLISLKPLTILYVIQMCCIPSCHSKIMFERVFEPINNWLGSASLPPKKQVEYWCWFGYLNQLGKWNSVHSIDLKGWGSLSYNSTCFRSIPQTQTTFLRTIYVLMLILTFPVILAIPSLSCERSADEKLPAASERRK